MSTRSALGRLFGQHLSHAPYPRIISSSYAVHQKFYGKSNLLYPLQRHLPVPISFRTFQSAHGAPAPDREASPFLEANTDTGSIEYIEVRSEDRDHPRFWRPFFFATSLGVGIFYAAAYASRAETEDLESEAQTQSWLSSFTSWSRNLDSEDRDTRLGSVKRARLLKSIQSLDEWLYKCGLGLAPREAISNVRRQWSDTSYQQKMCVSLLAMNFAVFVMWQIPSTRIRTFMTRHFLHHPLSGRSLTLLTAVFSHMAPLHFGMNMIALSSIGWAAFTFLGQGRSTVSLEKSNRHWPANHTMADFNPIYQCVAFFIAAGLCSSLTSHAISVLPRLMRSANSPKGLGSMIKVRPVSASLGASGAIYSTLVITALAYPSASVFLIFLPFIPIQIGPAVVGIVALDILGILRGWRFFDHWAHLAGAAFGAWYYYYGPYFWVRMKTLEAAVHSGMTKRTYNV